MPVMKGYVDGPVSSCLVLRSEAAHHLVNGGLLSRPPGACKMQTPMVAFLRKEVIQPQVPLRLPCYDFTPVAELTVAGCPLLPGWRTVFG